MEDFFFLTFFSLLLFIGDDTRGLSEYTIGVLYNPCHERCFSSGMNNNWV